MPLRSSDRLMNLRKIFRRKYKMEIKDLAQVEDGIRNAYHIYLTHTLNLRFNIYDNRSNIDDEAPARDALNSMLQHFCQTLR